MAEEKGESDGLDWSGSFPDSGGSEGASESGGDGGSVKGWEPGGPPPEKMTKVALMRERDGIYADKNYLRDDQGMSYWARQRMIRRLTAVNAAIGPVGPSPGMEENLTSLGITKESLAADMEKFAVRDETDEIEKGRRDIDRVSGGREQTEIILKRVQGVVKNYTTDPFIDRLFKSGTQNDPVIALAIHTIIERIENREAKLYEQKRRKGGRD